MPKDNVVARKARLFLASASFILTACMVDAAVAFDMSCISSRSLGCHALNGQCSESQNDKRYRIQIRNFDSYPLVMKIRQCFETGKCLPEQDYGFNFVSKTAHNQVGSTFDFNETFTEYQRSSVSIPEDKPQFKDYIFIEYGKCVKTPS